MTEEQKQLLELMLLFKSLDIENGGREECPELRLFSDGSGGILNMQDKKVVEWKDLDEAVIRLKTYLIRP